MEASVSTAVGSSGMAEGNKVLHLCASKRQIHHMRSALAFISCSVFKFQFVESVFISSEYFIYD